MKFWTKAQEAKLRANAAKAHSEGHDPKPVVKLFTPWGGATWLLTELHDDGTAFGLCDLGLGFPELGYVDTAELAALEGPFGLKVERDLYTKLDRPLSEYADLASREGRVVA